MQNPVQQQRQKAPPLQVSSVTVVTLALHRGQTTDIGALPNI